MPLPLPTSFGGREAISSSSRVQLEQRRSGAVPLSARAGRTWPAGRRSGRRRRRVDWERLRRARAPDGALPRGRARRHRLSAIFERIDPLPARRRGHPPRAARTTSPAHSHGMQVVRYRPLRLVAALVSRHGAGRLPAVAGRQPGLDRLSEDRGFRPPPARLARPDQPQPGTIDQLFADLRLRHLLAPDRAQTNVAETVRPVALAGRRQRRRHDPPRRDAGLRRRLRRGRLQRQRFLPSYGLAEATLAVSLMPPGEGIVVELVEETAAVRREVQPTTGARSAIARSSIAASRSRGMEVEIRDEDGDILPTRGIGKVYVPRRLGDGRLFPRRGSDPRLPCDDGWLDTGDMGYLSRRLHLHRRPRQGHDHHQRPQPLAAGHRMGGRAAARLQGRRHRRLLDHQARAAKRPPRSWSSAAHPTMRSAAGCATRSASGSARSPA